MQITAPRDERPREAAIRVSFLPEAREAALPLGSTVLDASRAVGLGLDAPCAGGGLCGACRVRHISPAPEPTAWDRLHLAPEELADGVRLGCLTHAAADAILSAPRRAPALSLGGRTYPYRLAPLSRRVRVRASTDHLTPETAEVLPRVALGDSPRRLTLHLLGRRVRGVGLGWRLDEHLGVALAAVGGDLHGWLADLETGEQLASARVRLIGQDADDATGDDAVRAAMRRLVRSLCAEADRTPEGVADAVLVGASMTGTVGTGEVPVRPCAPETDPVASRACAAALAVRRGDDPPTLLVGLEPHPWCVLLDGDGLWLAADTTWRLAAWPLAPVGADGALESAELGEPLPPPMGADAPTTLTLAAVVDCAEGLRSAGVLDHRGRLLGREAAPPDLPHALRDRLAPAGGRAAFRVTDRLTLDHRHVRAVQRLKAALAGLSVCVLEAADLEPAAVSRLVLIGDEAASLRVAAAHGIGLLPAPSPAMVQPFSDAIGVGARLALLSYEAARDLDTLLARCTRLETPGGAPQRADALYLDGPGRRPVPHRQHPVTIP